MNILNKLSIRNLKMNKKRTISTMIGIILSVSLLICAVTSMGTSFQATLVENAVNQTGYYHYTISNITAQNIETLKKTKQLKSFKHIRNRIWKTRKQSK